MHIVNVELKDIAFSPDASQFKATLLMDTDEARLCLRAVTDFTPGMHRYDIAGKLLQDAIAQIRRIPKYHDSGQEITVARNALAANPRLPLAA